MIDNYLYCYCDGFCKRNGTKTVFFQFLVA